MTFIYILLVACFLCIVLLLGILYRIVNENQKWEKILKNDTKIVDNDEDFINF